MSTGPSAGPGSTRLGAGSGLDGAGRTMPPLASVVLPVALLLGACDPSASGMEAPEAPGMAEEAAGTATQVPRFEPDPHWPEPLPDGWILGPITGIHVDARDHVWVTHAPGMLSAGALGAAQDPPIAECCVPAPRVVELDPDGRLVSTWDNKSDAYAWPDVPHGLFVDHTGHVWVGSRPHHQLLKFTAAGELVLAIGEEGVSGGSNDPDRLGMPAGIWVDPETNEAFVADGYRNRRVIVYDAASGAYLRHWGAYGDAPDDDAPNRPDDPELPPSRQFSTVHGLTGSRDGLLYVADRRNNRIQVFRQTGEFVDEVFARRGTLASGSAFDVALSPDPEQRFLYLADGTNHTIRIYDRATLEPLGTVGSGGTQLGRFLRPHVMDVDSRGNLYIGEADNARVQRFRPR